MTEDKTWREALMRASRRGWRHAQMMVDDNGHEIVCMRPDAYDRLLEVYWAAKPALAELEAKEAEIERLTALLDAADPIVTLANARDGGCVEDKEGE